MKRRGMSFCVSSFILIFFIDFTAFLVIYLKTFDYKVVRFYIEMQIFFAVDPDPVQSLVQESIIAASE